MDDLFHDGGLEYAALSTAFEPNDSLTTAAPIGAGTHTITGTNQDFFSFTAQAGFFEAVMTPTDRNINMVLITPSGSEIAAFRPGLEAETISRMLPESGTYTLRIFDAQFGDSPPAGFALNYGLNLTLPQTVADDANSTRTTATPLSEGTHDILGREVDWHRLDARAGFATFTMTEVQLLDDARDTRDDPRNLSLELRGAGGTLLKSVPSPSNTESFTFLIPDDGTYYLRVTTAQFGTTPPPETVLSYRLAVDFADPLPADNNDTQTTATPLTEGTHDIDGVGQDWFRVTSPSGPMSVVLTPDATTWPDGRTVNLNVTIRDASGTVLSSDTTRTSSGAETATATLPSDGTYFIRVSNADDQDGTTNVPLNYRLQVDLPEANTTELNDVRDTAPLLAEGTTSFNGTTVDWHRVETLSGRVTLTMQQTGTSASSAANLNMEVVFPDGSVVGANSTTGTETYSFVAPTDGVYFVKIFSAPFPDGAPNGVTLDYDLTLDLPAPNIAQPNDTRATAPLLAEGTTAFTGGTDVDWHRIEARSGLLQLTMTETGTGLNSAENLNMVLFDADGAELAGNTVDADTESFNYRIARDGTYFVRVTSAPFPDGAPNGVTLDYTLTMTMPPADPVEAGDTRATAPVISADSSGTYTGSDVDWYRIETGPGDMTFTLRHTGGSVLQGDPAFGTDMQEMDLNLELWDENGTEALLSNFVVRGDETIRFVADRSKTYFLKVVWGDHPESAPNGYRMQYGLDVNLPDKAWSTVLNFGPITNASVAVYDIDNDGKDEIFVGTLKGLDDQANEILPGGLVVLEDDGTVKWSQTFPAFAGPDPLTGKTYNTSSVTTQPIFSDVDGDGDIDILVGTAADSSNGFAPSGQPGDLGRLYALDAQGNILWFHQNIDSFGSAEVAAGQSGGPDGRPDGIYGAPRVFDIDNDGVREVTFTSWDHYFYALDGRTGAVERVVDLHDTAGATPAPADLNNDGLYELVVPGDITANARAGLPEQGGILHVLSNYGQQNIPGWNGQVGTSVEADFRGKFEPQSLWSSPQIVDLDRNGTVEIVQGTGNFFQDTRGSYIKVWNADGTLRFQFNTDGRTLASPLIADLDGNGSQEIVVATLTGHVYGISASGQQLFNTELAPFYNLQEGDVPPSELPIARRPIAVDLDNADGDLEILVTVGSQIIVLDSDGTQISNTDRKERSFVAYAGSPVAHDIDGDDRLDILSGGKLADANQGVVFRWENVADVTAPDFRTAAYQEYQSLHQIERFVERFYTTILGREADAAGRNDWTDKLYTGVRAGADVARGFIFSPEFTNRGTTDSEFVNILYSAFFGRAADTGGFNGWMTQLTNGAERSQVLDGFIGSQEFRNLSNSFGIVPQQAFGTGVNAALITGDPLDTSTLRGGAGNNVLVDEGTDVTRVTPSAVYGQVYRLYGATLGRIPDSGGFQGWVNGLTRETNTLSLDTAAGGFTGSPEFSNTYGTLDDAAFVNLLYRNVLNRDADEGGLNFWLNRLATSEDTPNVARANVVLGFSESQEYQNRTNTALDSYMRSIQPLWTDVLEGGAGNDTMNGGTGSDIFVFRQGQGGSDVIHGFEAWDELQFSRFGYDEVSDVLANMTQQGANVVFNHRGQEITFVNTQLSTMNRVRFNLS